MKHDTPVILVGGASHGSFVWASVAPSGEALMSDVHRAGKTYRFNQEHGIVLGKNCLTAFVYLEGLQNLSLLTIRRLQLSALNSVELDTSQVIGIPRANSFITLLAEYVADLPTERADLLNEQLEKSVAWDGGMVKVVEYMEFVYMAGYMSLQGKVLLPEDVLATLKKTITLNDRIKKVVGRDALLFMQSLLTTVGGAI